MTDKNKIPEPERSSGNEVGCYGLLARKKMQDCILGSDAWWLAYYVLHKAEK